VYDVEQEKMTMGQMRWETIIDKNGEVQTSVLERGDQTECVKIKQFTDGLGTELSDERTGPECDKVEEIQGY